MGSLLGVSVNRGVSSFPVGKVQFLEMYPMDFEEYLWARGEESLSKTKSHHGHHTRLSGSYFRCVGAFSKSGADTAALGWNQEETIGEDQIDPCSQSHSRKATRQCIPRKSLKASTLMLSAPRI